MATMRFCSLRCPADPAVTLDGHIDKVIQEQLCLAAEGSNIINAGQVMIQRRLDGGFDLRSRLLILVPVHHKKLLLLLRQLLEQVLSRKLDLLLLCFGELLSCHQQIVDLQLLLREPLRFRTPILRLQILQELQQLLIVILVLGPAGVVAVDNILVPLGELLSGTDRSSTNQ